MRENRPYGSEGGVAGNGHPYPYDGDRLSGDSTAAHRDTPHGAVCRVTIGT